jgi:hypothetical protein
MEQPCTRADGAARLAWISAALCFLGLLAAQVWLTLGLFGPDRPWQRLLNDEPILSGRHPLHLYHGVLGACSLRSAGTLCCYDPAFEAGYPKTPVFDSGSRPAELFLDLAGGQYRPAAYKVGLAVCCVAVPIAVAVAAWGAGLGPWACCLAAVLGMLVGWGAPCRVLVEGGDIDMFLGGLASLVCVGMLLRFHSSPGPLAWLGLVAGVGIGCLAHPLFFFVLLVAVLLAYYLSVGTRHGLTWHTCLVTALTGGIALNLFWLLDWVKYWWVLLPLPTGERLLPHRTLRAFWEAPLWGGLADRSVALVLLGGGLIGLGIFNQCRGRPAARLLGIGAVGLLVLALLGIACEPAGRVGAMKLLVPALWFATLPAAFACQKCGIWLRRCTGCPWITLSVGILLAALASWASWPTPLTFVERWCAPVPLAIGLGPERQAVTSLLKEKTTPEARVLWEDQADGSRWSALLPLLTDRSFIGGLDPEAALEHSYHTQFADHCLAGRPLSQWSDAELEEFCRRYNLGWVVCWTSAAQARLRGWNRAAAVATLNEDGQTGCLFALQRPRSFVLKGQAGWVSADCRHIALSDVVPEDGKVVLSLHYQAGLQVSPAKVRVEKEPAPPDLIPFVRLRMPGPVTRITLRWEAP